MILAVSLTVAAAGYRVNWQTFNLQKTGLFVLNSDPRPASISMNGNLLATQTPLRLSYLLPGWYDLVVQKDGYIPWEKTLKVEGGIATYEKRITLWRKTPQPVTLTADEQAALQKQLGAITPQLTDNDLQVRGSEIWIGDTLVARLLGDIKQVKWFPTHNAYLVQIGSVLHAFQTDGTNDVKLLSFQTTNAVPLLWQDGGDNLVILDSGTAKKYLVH